MPEKELIISREDIVVRVRELGAAISKDYAGVRLLIVGILNGSFIFTADLVREIRVDVEIDFMRAASYGMETTAGDLKLTKDVELEIRNRDVLIVEDIVDTGRTLKYLRQTLVARGARSVRICALIDKQERREVDIQIDYIGFEVREGFLVGYGLDCRELYRNLPAIYHLQDI